MRSILFATAALGALAISTQSVQADHCYGGYYGGYHRPYYGPACDYGFDPYLFDEPCYDFSYRGWSSYCYLPRYGCYGYYCPRARCWYYYYAPFRRYLPVRYISRYVPVVRGAPSGAPAAGAPTPQLPPGATPVPAPAAPGGAVPALPKVP